MSGDRGLVFIVDDDDAVGIAMARVLRASGFDVLVSFSQRNTAF